MTERPPFDEHDAAQALRYLKSKDWAAFDPLIDTSPADSLFALSLASMRALMQESFAAKGPDGRPFRGYPLFVDRPHVNAFAVRDEDLEVCGVNVGMMNAAYEIALFVFSQSTMFKEVGDASAEASPVLPPGARLSFWIATRMHEGKSPEAGPIGQEFVPRDPHRQLAAILLAHLLVRFAWLHELYHGLNGHTGLLAKWHIGLPLHEMPDDASMPVVETESPETAVARTLTRHCMEFDADRTALWAMMRLQHDDREPIEALATLPKPLRLKLTLFAAMMMTFLFDQATHRKAVQDGATHPLAYHRLHNVMRTVASHLLDPEGEVKHAVAHLLVEMTQLEECLPELFSATDLLRDLASPDYQRELEKIEAALIPARRDFGRFAYRGA